MDIMAALGTRFAGDKVVFARLSALHVMTGKPAAGRDCSFVTLGYW